MIPKGPPAALLEGPSSAPQSEKRRVHSGPTAFGRAGECAVLQAARRSGIRDAPILTGIPRLLVERPPNSVGQPKYHYRNRLTLLQPEFGTGDLECSSVSHILC